MNLTETSLPGVLLLDLDVFPDERGSFREVWQTEKMSALGLPDFRPVQSNISESKYGVIRGVHAEPWDKLIHLAYGTAFAAIVDLREDQPTFGEVATFELDSSKVLYLPKGMGNSFQATSELAVYAYLVTAHWSADLPYKAIAFDDPDLAINWPVSGESQIVSEKDRRHPTMRQEYPNKYK